MIDTQNENNYIEGDDYYDVNYNKVLKTNTKQGIYCLY